MLMQNIMGICAITGFFLLRSLQANTCVSPNPYLKDDVITALTWVSVGRTCPDSESARFINETKEHLSLLIQKEQNATKKVLSRKRRFYNARDPILTCELRYFIPLFSVSTELASFVTIEFPSGVDLAYPIMSNNVRKAGLEASDIFSGIENLISKLGVDGKTCMLRAICDVASITPMKPQGIIRDAMEVAIRHMLKEVKSTDDEAEGSTPLSKMSYLDAAIVGKSGHSCAEEFYNCPFTFLSLINYENV